VRIAYETAAGERLVIEHGRVANSDSPPDLLVTVGAAQFRAGLINGHDHLSLNHFGRLGSPPYEDAYAWEDIHELYRAAIERARALPRRDALLFGALKNIVGGVTTVVHHDPWDDLFDCRFPIHVAPVHLLHSVGNEPDPATALAASAAPAAAPVCIHLAEGTNARAAAEVGELARRGLLNERLLAVHVVGVDAGGVAHLHGARAAVVWCPTSNEFLFGRTAPCALFASGIDTLLGTDSLLTGAGTMLDELRAARAHACLDDDRLLAAVGTTAARRLGVAPPSLTPGAVADVIALRAPVLDARPADVVLVVAGGRPVLADEALAELFAATGAVCEPIVAGGVRKLVAAPLGAVLERVLELVPDAARFLD
jgi:cytosine/adenosine deaminase-related metal-dependent hydrolase